MKTIGVKTALFVALVGACAAGCDGGSGNKMDARADAKVDAGADTSKDMMPATDAKPDMTGGEDVNPAVDMNPSPDMAVDMNTNPDAAVDLPATPDMAADMNTNPDGAVDVPAMPDMAVDMTPPTDGAADMAATTRSIGGTVSGLVGTGLVLRNNGGDSLTVTPSATVFPFTFATRQAMGTTYNVTVQTQPTSPTQVCVVTNGTGMVGNANITSITVTCTTQTFAVGGTITGLAGTGLVLQNNGGGNQTIPASATSYQFPAQASGSTYAITVLTQPGSPAQICTVANGSGTVGGANVSNANITCATQAYTVGGTITGLTGAGLVLRNNGGDNLTVPANATSFTFATSVAAGGAYAVTILTQPAGQICTVNSGTGSGTVGSANVTTPAITCVNTYTVGGTISGYTGSGLVLRNNGGDDITVASGATTFTFPTRLLTGAAYAVTVQTQPTSPAQTCTVAMGSGNIAAANISNVAITCTTGYTIGGTISGLTTGGLVLRNNGMAATDLTVASGATSFTFAASQNTGTMYDVTVQTQPSAAVQCAVMGTTGMGTVASANVTSIVIQCTPRYSVGGTISGLSATGLILRLNGMAPTDLTVPSGGTSFTFAPPLLATTTAYAVTVQQQPTGLTCTPSMATGTIGSANVTNVAIACVTASAPVTVCAVDSAPDPNVVGDELQVTDGETGVITCPTGKTITAITFASYGTPTGTCGAGTYMTSSCHSTESMARVTSLCPPGTGLSTCSVQALYADPPAGFGDPCSGMEKNLRIAVTCQ